MPIIEDGVDFVGAVGLAMVVGVPAVKPKTIQSIVIDVVIEEGDGLHII